MYKKAHTPSFKHKKRVIKAGNGSTPNGARPPEHRPEFQINTKLDDDRLIKERMRELDRRTDRNNREAQSTSASTKARKRKPSKDRGGYARSDDDIEPMLVRQLQELTQRMDAMQSYGSVNNLNLSPRGKNQFMSNYGDSPGRQGNGYHSDGDAGPPIARSFPALPGNYGQPSGPMGGIGPGAHRSDGMMMGYQNQWNAPNYDSSPFGQKRISPSYQSDRDDIRKSLTQQNMELQSALQDTRNEYLKAMTMLEGETYERQQLERKTADLSSKLAASRQALAVTQTALSSLQDANEEGSRTRDIRDIEIEKYLSEIKVKDSKISALESRSKELDEHMNNNMSRKDETIQKLQKKLTDALDTAYKAENDASTVSKDLSIAEQEIYSLRNRLTHMDLDHSEAVKRMEKEYKHKIENLNESLSKALLAQDQSEKNVLRSATLEAKNIELEARVRYLDSAIVKLEREKGGKDSDLLKLQADLSALTHEKSLSASSFTLELEDKIKRLEKTVHNMTEREASLISERNDLQAELSIFKKRVDELSDNSSNPVITELEYAKSLLQKESDHLKRQHDALEEELAAVKRTLKSNDEQSIESVKKQVASKEDEIRQLYADLNAAREENSLLMKAIGDSSTSSSEVAIQTVTADRDRLTSLNSALETDLREASLQRSELERQLGIKTREAVDLENRLDEKTSELTALQTKINSNKFVAPTAFVPENDPVSAPTPVAETVGNAQELLPAEEESTLEKHIEEQTTKSTSKLHSEESSLAGDAEKESKKKKKKKKKSKGSTKGRRTPKSARSSAYGSDEEPEEDTISLKSNSRDGSRAAAEPDPVPDSVSSVRNDENSEPSSARRSGFSVPTPEPPANPPAEDKADVADSNQNVTNAEVRQSPVKPASAVSNTSSSSGQPPSTQLNNIFTITPSPAVASRKHFSPAGGNKETSAGAAEQQGYNSLRGGSGNGASSAKSNSAANLRQELTESNAEKKKLKKGINKWNTDFLLANNREAGVEDKSSDPVITKLYQQYHEISMVIKSKEEALEGLKIYS